MIYAIKAKSLRMQNNLEMQAASAEVLGYPEI
jgi:hypothetical protein